MAVAADDRHAGLRQTQFGSDDVHDPLLGVADVVQLDAEVLTVLAGASRSAASRSDPRSADFDRSFVGMLWSGVATVRSCAPVPPRDAKRLERLGAGHFVDELQIDVEQVRLAGRGAHDVAVPDLLGQRQCRHESHSGWTSQQTTYARTVTATSEIAVDAPLRGDWAAEVRELARRAGRAHLGAQLPGARGPRSRPPRRRLAAAGSTGGRSTASTIILCGVHFMAESAKLLAPDRRVLIPDLGAGCSLADTITADQLREWKAEHPGAAVVSYVNTSAAVKAETDICCTSSNAVDVVNSIPIDRNPLPSRSVPRCSCSATYRTLEHAHLDGRVPCACRDQRSTTGGQSGRAARR